MLIMEQNTCCLPRKSKNLNTMIPQKEIQRIKIHLMKQITEGSRIPFIFPRRSISIYFHGISPVSTRPGFRKPASRSGQEATASNKETCP